MNPHEATDLAVRILGCWKGPNAREWEETLISIDAGRAGTAFARLRREHDKQWLSIAEFLQVANALRTDDPVKTDPCQWCDDTGWVQADDIVKPGGTWPEPCRACKGASNEDRKACKPCAGSGEVLVKRVNRYSAVKPCGCREGRRREQSAVWTDHNATRRSAA